MNLAKPVRLRETIELRSPASLQPAARNARTHSRKQVRQIADSIQRFGFTNPVLIDAESRILAGHGRIEAAKLLGLAAHARAVRSGGGLRPDAQEPGRVEQDEWRNGQLLPFEARAYLCVQIWRCTAHQQLRARRYRPLSHQCLGLSGYQQHFCGAPG